MKKILSTIGMISSMFCSAQLYTPNGNVQTSNNGNVGIGTQNPQAQFDVSFINSEPKSMKFIQFPNAANSMNAALRYTWYNDTADMGLIRSGDSKIEGLAVRFNESEQVRFNANGNVGIGTQNPQAQFDVSFTNSEPKSMKFIQFPNAASSMNAALRYTWYNNTADMGLIRSGGTDIEGMAVRFNESEKVRFNANGNVGIGTQNPQAKLEIKAGSDGGQGPIEALRIWGPNSPQGVSSSRDINFQFTAAGSSIIRSYRGNAWDTYLQFLTSPESSNTGGIPLVRMHISGNGNVGIGSVNPDEKLTVKGHIHAEEVRVDNNVPVADYVFQKYYTGKSSLKQDYQMPTIAEVEKYTRENHHLPNIPSAQEIKEKGLQLGEMSNLLLQKIEELTLYTIQQQKELKVQAEKIKILEKKLKRKR